MVTAVGGNLYDDPLPYTASIDAALTLVPEGCGWEIYNTTCDQPKVWAKVYGWPGCDEAARANATTPALALCIAALRARARPATGGREGT